MFRLDLQNPFQMLPGCCDLIGSHHSLSQKNACGNVVGIGGKDRLKLPNAILVTTDGEKGLAQPKSGPDLLRLKIQGLLKISDRGREILLTERALALLETSEILFPNLGISVRR